MGMERDITDIRKKSLAGDQDTWVVNTQEKSWTERLWPLTAQLRELGF